MQLHRARNALCAMSRKTVYSEKARSDRSKLQFFPQCHRHFRPYPRSQNHLLRRANAGIVGARSDEVLARRIAIGKTTVVVHQTPRRIRVDRRYRRRQHDFRRQRKNDGRDSDRKKSRVAQQSNLDTIHSEDTSYSRS